MRVLRILVIWWSVGFAVELVFSLVGLSIGLLPLWLSLVRLWLAPASLLWLANPEAGDLTRETAAWALLVSTANGLVYSVIAGGVKLLSWLTGTRREGRA